MLNKNQRKMLGILYSTIKFMDTSKWCSRKYQNSKGQRCAISRYFSQRTIDEIKNHGYDGRFDGVSIKITALLLKNINLGKKINELPIAFWSDIQKLNDTSTASREFWIDLIKDKIKDNKYV